MLTRKWKASKKWEEWKMQMRGSKTWLICITEGAPVHQRQNEANWTIVFRHFVRKCVCQDQGWMRIDFYFETQEMFTCHRSPLFTRSKNVIFGFCANMHIGPKCICEENSLDMIVAPLVVLKALLATYISCKQAVYRWTVTSSRVHIRCRCQGWLCSFLHQ